MHWKWVSFLLFRTYIWTVGDNEYPKDCLLPGDTVEQSEDRRLFAFWKEKNQPFLTASGKILYFHLSCDVSWPHSTFKVNTAIFSSVLSHPVALPGISRIPKDKFLKQGLSILHLGEKKFFTDLLFTYIQYLLIGTFWWTKWNWSVSSH